MVEVQEGIWIFGSLRVWGKDIWLTPMELYIGCSRIMNSVCIYISTLQHPNVCVLIHNFLESQGLYSYPNFLGSQCLSLFPPFSKAECLYSCQQSYNRIFSSTFQLLHSRRPNLFSSNHLFVCVQLKLLGTNFNFRSASTTFGPLVPIFEASASVKVHVFSFSLVKRILTIRAGLLLWVYHRYRNCFLTSLVHDSHDHHHLHPIPAWMLLLQAGY
jgi:hypothetical protein